MSKIRYRRASEIGEFVYCHRAWWLHHVEGHEPGNVRARAQGAEAHARHGLTLRLAALLRRVALAVALVAAVLILLDRLF